MTAYQKLLRAFAKAVEQGKLLFGGAPDGPGSIKNNPNLKKKRLVDKRGRQTTRYVRRDQGQQKPRGMKRLKRPNAPKRPPDVPISERGKVRRSRHGKVTTASGREIPAPPRYQLTSERAARQGLRDLKAWLVREVQAEAKARGDDWSQTLFQNLDPKNLSQADQDAANLYLFGEENPTWETEAQAGLGLGSEAGEDGPQVGDEKVEDGRRYRLNENHRWERVGRERAKKDRRSDLERALDTEIARLQMAGEDEQAAYLQAYSDTMLPESPWSKPDERDRDAIVSDLKRPWRDISAVETGGGKRYTVRYPKGSDHRDGRVAGYPIHATLFKQLRDEGLLERTGVEGSSERWVWAGSTTSGSESEPAEPPAPPDDTPSDEAEEEHGDYDDYGEVIGGARKHLAQIRRELEAGERTLDISDLDALEEDAGVAASLVNRDMIVGDALDKLRESGFTPGGAFLFRKLIRTIPKKPPKDSPRDRKLYVKALQRVMSMMESASSVNDVREAMSGLATLWFGEFVPASMQDEYDELKVRKDAIDKAVYDAQSKERRARVLAVEARREQLALAQQIAALRRQGKTEEADAKQAERDKYVAAWKEAEEEQKQHAKVVGRLKPDQRAVRREWNALKDRLQKLDQEQDLPWHDAMEALGDRFRRYIGVRSSRDSNSTFKTRQKNITAAIQHEKDDDWSWLDGKKKGGQKKRRSRPKWERDVPEEVVREGGETHDWTSESLAETFNIRGVQYGNYMDEESSREHTQSAGDALMDLAAILGVTPEQVSLKGRLAIAFGARGHGRAMAHYERTQTVINLTKWNGGGSLAHEWAHFLDNILARVSWNGEGGHNTFVSDSIMGRIQQREQLGDGLSDRVLQAARKVGNAIRTGDYIEPVEIEVTEPPTRRNGTPIRYRNSVRLDDYLKKHDGDAQAAFDHWLASNKVVETMRHSSATRYGLKRWRRAKNNARDVARYMHIATGQPVKARLPGKPGDGTSRFYATAASMGQYWSRRHELFARAFETFVHDELKSRGMRNTYLVGGIDEDSIAAWGKAQDSDAITSVYPLGEERKRINAAIRELIDALHGDDAFAKAVALLARKEGAYL